MASNSTSRSKNKINFGFYALRYAERGIPVFRLAPGTRVPHRGSHGSKDATCNPSQICRWWWQSPQSNIGVLTGPVSGILILDVDPRHGGPT
jgi:hypothetical protein